MVAGLIHDVPTVAVLMDRIMAQAGDIIRARLSSMVGAASPGVAALASA